MSSQSFRLATGGRIDRSRPLSFRFDGHDYQGYAGDTLASALLANGVRVVGRSFRLHRPRGVVGAGAEEPNAIVQLGAGAATRPNLKATQVALFDGLEARAVNAWPNARFDVGAILGAAPGLLPAGFYYKTFIWPRWGVFSPFIRRMGGLGRAPRAADGEVYAKTFAACDVLVVGAGPAGLSAALGAARSGARVILVDDKPELGGSLLEGQHQIDGESALNWVARVEHELEAFPEVRILRRTTATGCYDHNLLTLSEDCGPGEPSQRFWKVRTGRVVLCAGAFERPLVFPGNDRPGVMLASAARAYALRFGVLPGRRVVVVTNNDSAYAAAIDLAAVGVEIAGIVDLRSEPRGPLVDELRRRGVAILAGHAPVATKGRGGISSISLATLDADGRANGAQLRLACDLVAVSGGWNPTVHLHSQAGGRLVWDEFDACFKPHPDGVTNSETVGAAAGDMTLSAALSGGAAAGARAARARGFAAESPTAVAPDVADTTPIRPLWDVEGAKGLAWVDLQNDVTSRDVRQAARENYASVEHLKRYTTLGMALDQGKTSNINGVGLLAQVLDKPMANVGTTKFRPPFNPVSLGAIAGRRLGDAYRALMRLPTDARQAALGASMDEYGGWSRPAFYQRPGEGEEDAVRREAALVRASVGLFDASPLGKILVAGPDAAAFLERVYVNPIASLAVGRCRYGLMLDEQGALLDDGVLSRLGPTRFLVSTSSGQAGAVAEWLEDWLQCEWPALDVVVQPVTSQWATLTIAGPLARGVLEALEPGLDLSDASLPHMATREVVVAGAPCRLTRVSFTGERSYEISVSADQGVALWDALLVAGAPLGIAPVGVEAVLRLRLEKGFVLVGIDTETTTYPQDIGHGRLKSRDFIGRRSTQRRADGPGRQLVGVEALSVADPLPIGGHLTRSGGADRSEGWVTSSGFSPVLERWVALALVENGLSRLGETLTLHDQGRRLPVRLREICSYDPLGARLNA